VAIKEAWIIEYPCVMAAALVKNQVDRTIIAAIAVQEG
jgi:hypothetical protein